VYNFNRDNRFVFIRGVYHAKLSGEAAQPEGPKRQIERVKNGTVPYRDFPEIT
jgi:hypothetical protein